MHAEEVKNSDNIRSISEVCVFFICLFAALTVHYKFLTYHLSFGRHGRGTKKDAASPDVAGTSASY
jgi:hypothetical protein